MHFDSTLFVGFFAAVLCGYWLLKSVRAQNLWLLAASYAFYGSSSWKFLALLIATTVIDYSAARMIAGANLPSRRRAILAMSVTANLVILIAAKYAGFFVADVAGLLRALGMQPNLPILHVIVPAGISLYTLQSMGYVLDVYRGKEPLTRSLLDHALFVAFFPQLIAGPIERAAGLLPQLQTARTWSRDDFEGGAQLAIWGLLKKIAIADNLAAYVNAVYAQPSAFSGRVLTTATVFFAVQIYCELSGYVDIARGAARMLGIGLSEHYRHPYFARTPLEFWSRWQITLMQWFEDYVRAPLQRSLVRANERTALVIAYLLSMTLIGLWQGPDMHFVAFGLYWGLAIILYLSIGGAKSAGELTQLRSTAPQAGKLRSWSMTCAMFAVVSVGWIFFRAESLQDAWYIATHLAATGGLNSVLRPEVFGEPILWCLVFGLWAIELLQRNGGALVNALIASEWRRLLLRHAMLIVTLGAYFMAQNAAVRELIEFQF